MVLLWLSDSLQSWSWLPGSSHLKCLLVCSMALFFLLLLLPTIEYLFLFFSVESICHGDFAGITVLPAAFQQHSLSGNVVVPLCSSILTTHWLLVTRLCFTVLSSSSLTAPAVLMLPLQQRFAFFSLFYNRQLQIANCKSPGERCTLLAGGLVSNHQHHTRWADKHYFFDWSAV